MAVVIFYEKPGCATNARQKRLLAASGHTVDARSLLTESWTAQRLLRFFHDVPVSAWFNPASPRVKSGEIDPRKIGAETALALMVADPLLIKRPLIEVDNQRICGFDAERIRTLIAPNESLDQGAPQGCAHPNDPAPCPPPLDAHKSAR
ncbi:MAG: ArsC/Spx/MgsR family protein [Rhizomicrobium sp.]